jgi:hypothetical protein
MFTAALRCATSILFFRAGPQDMPFDTGHDLTRRCVAFTLVAFALFSVVLLSPLAAVLVAALSVLGLGLSTRAALALRKLESRFQQTFNALLLTNALLMLAMTPLLMILAPTMVEVWQRLMHDPTLAEHPEKLPQIPQIPTLLFDILGIWQFAVCARVYGQATGGGMFSGVLTAILCFFAMTLFVMFASPLIGLLGG